jgi:DNA-directed RNA polymerase subunit RPC12/RpoP
MNDPNQIAFTLSVHWVCPSCGKRQFKKLVPAELNMVQRKEILEDYKVDPQSLDSLMVAPRRVRCRTCKAKFKVEMN